MVTAVTAICVCKGIYSNCSSFCLHLNGNIHFPMKPSFPSRCFRGGLLHFTRPRSRPADQTLPVHKTITDVRHTRYMTLMAHWKSYWIILGSMNNLSDLEAPEDRIWFEGLGAHTLVAGSHTTIKRHHYIICFVRPLHSKPEMESYCW